MERPPIGRLVQLFAGDGAIESVTNPNLPVVATTDTETGAT
jgi:hypothetical protein